MDAGLVISGWITATATSAAAIIAARMLWIARRGQRPVVTLAADYVEEHGGRPRYAEIKITVSNRRPNSIRLGSVGAVGAKDLKLFHPGSSFKNASDIEVAMAEDIPAGETKAVIVHFTRLSQGSAGEASGVTVRYAEMLKEVKIRSVRLSREIKV